MTHLTEREAKTKWCPWARLGVYAGTGAVAVNRDVRPNLQDDCNCLATRCMMWVPVAPTKPRRYRANETNDAICQWVRNNPIPFIFREGSAEEDRILDAHAKEATVFAKELPVTERPAIDGLDDSRWEWIVGWDDEERRPFAHWHYPPEPRGRCGIVNALNMEG